MSFMERIQNICDSQEKDHEKNLPGVYSLSSNNI